MSFFAAIKTCFRKYFTFEGRANRREFWYWIGFFAILFCVATLIDGVLIAPAFGYLPFEQEAGRPLAYAVMALLALPTVTAAVRRVHDSNLTGWWLLSLIPAIFAVYYGLHESGLLAWQLLGMIMILGAIPMIYFLIKGSKKGDNRFGA